MSDAPDLRAFFVDEAFGQPSDSQIRYLIDLLSEIRRRKVFPEALAATGARKEDDWKNPEFFKARLDRIQISCALDVVKELVD